MVEKSEPDEQSVEAERRQAGKLLETGVEFTRKLRARGAAACGKPADKQFRDSLYED